MIFLLVMNSSQMRVIIPSLVYIRKREKMQSVWLHGGEDYISNIPSTLRGTRAMETKMMPSKIINVLPQITSFGCDVVLKTPLGRNQRSYRTKRTGYRNKILIREANRWKSSAHKHKDEGLEIWLRDCSDLQGGRKCR